MSVRRPGEGRAGEGGGICAFVPLLELFLVEVCGFLEVGQLLLGELALTKYYHQKLVLASDFSLVILLLHRPLRVCESILDSHASHCAANTATAAASSRGDLEVTRPN